MDVKEQNASAEESHKQEHTDILQGGQMNEKSPDAISTAGESDAKMPINNNDDDGIDDPKVSNGQADQRPGGHVNGTKSPVEEEPNDDRDESDNRENDDHDFDESANEETRLQLLSATVRDQDDLERMVGRQV